MKILEVYQRNRTINTVFHIVQTITTFFKDCSITIQINVTLRVIYIVATNQNLVINAQCTETIFHMQYSHKSMKCTVKWLCITYHVL